MSVNDLGLLPPQFHMSRSRGLVTALLVLIPPLGLVAWLNFNILGRPTPRPLHRHGQAAAAARRQLRWQAPAVPKSSTDTMATPAAQPERREAAVAVTPPATAGSAGSEDQCHSMPRTELHGDVVRWGTDHIVESAAACCEACRAASAKPGRRNCTVWVYCDQSQCGEMRGQCWLKNLADPYVDIDLIKGRSDRWTSGTMEAPPAQVAMAAAAPSDADLALVTAYGRIRIALRAKSPLAKAW